MAIYSSQVSSYRRLSLFLSLGSNACHRKNGWAFKRWATKPPGAPRSSHVSKDIKSTRWRNMKCNDAAGKGERRRATRWCTMCRVHGIDLHPSATPSVFPNRGFLCGFSARAADAYRPLQLFGRANLDSSSSRSQRASSIHEIPPPFALLPPSPPHFGGRERNGEITTGNRDERRFCSEIGADVNR